MQAVAEPRSLSAALFWRAPLTFATRISAPMYLVPPLAMILAGFILGEAVGPLAFAGLALSVAGTCIVGRRTP
jgi:drug/metabolite transporter (DMT)-like permease